MQKFKYVKVMIIVFCISILYWCMAELPVIMKSKENHFLENMEEYRILGVVGHSGGYEDILGIILFVFPFCLCLNYILMPCTVSLFVRLKSRKEYVLYSMKHTIIFAILFSVIREGIDIIGMLTCFDFFALRNIQFFKCIMVSLLALILFFIQVGSVLQLFNVCFSRKCTGVAVFFMYMFEYLLIRVKLIYWAPCCDSAILPELLEKGISNRRIVFLFLEGTIFCIFLMILFRYFFFTKGYFEK